MFTLACRHRNRIESESRFLKNDSRPIFNITPTSPRNHDLLLSYLLFFLTDQHTTAHVQVIYDIKETKYNSN